MARPQNSARKSALKAEVKQILAEDEDLLKAMVIVMLQQTLEAEMDEALAAEKSERTAGRLGHWSGYYGRALITRIGKTELRVPQDRQGRFCTEVFERYQRAKRRWYGHDGDVLTGRVDAQGESRDRRAVRPRVQFRNDQSYRIQSGRGNSRSLPVAGWKKIIHI